MTTGAASSEDGPFASFGPFGPFGPDEPDGSGEPAHRPGPFLRTAGTILPGIRRVQNQIGPYASAWRASNAEALAAGAPLWVALGDSMTQGVGAASIWGGWVGQALEQLMPAYHVVNLSVSGARIRDVAGPQLDRLAGLGIVPDLVTVLIGSNDLFRRNRRASAVADFGVLLDRLPIGSFVATLPQPRQVAREINVLIEAARARRQIRIVDLRGGPGLGSWRGALAEDHFHPNEVGYARLAGAFATAINAASA